MRVVAKFMSSGRQRACVLEKPFCLIFRVEEITLILRTEVEGFSKRLYLSAGVHDVASREIPLTVIHSYIPLMLRTALGSKISNYSIYMYVGL